MLYIVKESDNIGMAANLEKITMVDEVRDIAQIRDDTKRRRAIVTLAERLREERGKDEAARGMRLMYLRKLLRSEGIDDDEIGLARDEELTRAMNDRSQERAAGMMDSASAPIHGYSRRAIVERLTEVARATNPDALVSSGRMRQKIIRMLCVAAALRPIEFSRISVLKVRGDRWIVRNFAKARGRTDERPFLALIAPDDFVHLIDVAREWIGQPCADGYPVMDPMDARERYRFKTEYNNAATYRDLRAIGVSAIGYADAEASGVATGARYHRAAEAAARHKPTQTATDHYMRYEDDTGVSDDDERAGGSAASASEDDDAGSASDSQTEEDEEPQQRTLKEKLAYIEQLLHGDTNGRRSNKK